MKIEIGSKIFTVTIGDKETVKAIKALLPLTLKMDDINSMKRYSFFQQGSLAIPSTLELSSPVI